MLGESRPVYQPSGGDAGELGEDAHGLGEVGALGVDVDVLVADPAQAVAGDLVAGVRARPRTTAGLACSARATPNTVSGSAALGEQPQDPPDAGPAAVLVERLHAQVAVGERLRADDLGEERLRRRVAVEHAALAALLDVQHERHRDAGAARPRGSGGCGP